ncbi:MAG: hypothetical protein V2A69_15905 [Pseudomonadota bacterium]
MAVIKDSVILVEKDFFSPEAGNSKENYFLKGLWYRLTIKVTGTVKSIYLYSSDIPEDETNRFSFTDQGGGVYVYEEEAGANSGPTDSALASTGSSFADGLGFYFRVKITGENSVVNLDRRFWVRDPVDLVKLTSRGLFYESPYPVIVESRPVPVALAGNAKNEAGVCKYGGIATVQILTTPTAPSTGSHVAEVAETAIANVTSMTLADRSAGSSIPGFIPAPGAEDYSRFYHYVTFRLRALQGSAHSRDIDTILFAMGTCEGNTGGTYGYSFVFSPPVVPSLNLIPPDNPPTEPPPVCSSTTELKTTQNLNQYAISTKVNVYDAASGGTLLASGTPTITGAHTLEIMRTALGGTTSQPIAGYFEIQEYGPDRTSDRYETFVNGCTVVPVEITSIVPGLEIGIVNTTPGSRDFDAGKTYQVRFYATKYGALGNTYAGTYISEHVLSFPMTTDKDGYWEITEDGIAITPEKFNANVSYVGSIEIESITYSSPNGVVTSTTGSRHFDAGKTYQVRFYATENGPVANTYAGTYISAHVVNFPLAENKDGFWDITEDGIILNTTQFEEAVTVGPPEIIYIVTLQGEITMPYVAPYWYIYPGPGGYLYEMSWFGPGYRLFIWQSPTVYAYWRCPAALQGYPEGIYNIVTDQGLGAIFGSPITCHY